MNLRDKRDIVLDAYEALNRNDINAMVRHFGPDVEWIDPPGADGVAESFRGFDTVRAYIAKARATWEAGACTPERIFGAGDKVAVFIYVHAKVKGQSDWVEGRLVDVYTFKDDKVIKGQSFLDRTAALDDASIPASERPR